MPKCKNEVLLSKIGIKKVTATTEVDFTVLDDLSDCKRIMANTYIASSVSNPSWNAFRRPQNRFECEDTSCMSGTLFLGTAGNVTYKAQYDATDFAAGVVTFYTQVTGEAGTKITFSISDTSSFANADVYTKTFKPSDALDDGYVPVVIDLSQTPSSTEGDGWQPSVNGAFIKIAADSALVISSISIFDSMDDFEISDTVKVGCISGIEGTDDIDAAEATCFGGGYDTTSPNFERTITGNSVTPNYWKLNPLLGKGERTTGFVTKTISKKIVASANGEYGVITLADMSDDCGFMTISIEDSCNITDAHLERLSIPTLVNMDEKHYVVLDGVDGAKDIYFNKSLVGVDVVISYPQTARVRERVADIENVGSRRVRMAHKYTQTDGVEVMRVYGNVLVTSFPMTINEEETEFAFTINIQKDINGHYYREWVIEA